MCTGEEVDFFWEVKKLPRGSYVIIDISSRSLLSDTELMTLFKYFMNSIRISSGSSSRFECTSFSLFRGGA
jgi:hypothetical protein